MAAVRNDKEQWVLFVLKLSGLLVSNTCKHQQAPADPTLGHLVSCLLGVWHIKELDRCAVNANTPVPHLTHQSHNRPGLTHDTHLTLAAELEAVSQQASQMQDMTAVSEGLRQELEQGLAQAQLALQVLQTQLHESNQVGKGKGMGSEQGTCLCLRSCTSARHHAFLVSQPVLQLMLAA